MIFLTFGRGRWPPTIVVSGARGAMACYLEVFGVQRRGEFHVNADGTTGHAEAGIGDAVLMFAEASGPVARRAHGRARFPREAATPST
jgi:uncharacterized glyoxalase superfamily protein PhnB